MNRRFRLPISLKLTTISVALLLVATVPIAVTSSNYFESVSVKREEDTNRDQARTRATEVENLLTNYLDKARVVGDLLSQPASERPDSDPAFLSSFFRDGDFVAVDIYMRSENGHQLYRRIIKEDYLTSHQLAPKYIESVREKKNKAYNFISAAFAGSIEVRNSSEVDGAPLITLAFPRGRSAEGEISHVVVADFRLDKLQAAFSKITEREIYLVDRDGILLAHSNDAWVFAGYSLAELEIVRKAKEANDINQWQMTFQNPMDEYRRYIGSFSRTLLGPVVVSQVSEDIILEPARVVRRQAFLITGIILSLTLFLISVFSITLTGPIEKLLELTKEISKGNFQVVARTKIKSHDEVGELAEAFDHMTAGLQERDKVKSMFSKFHGSSVTEDLLKSDLNLGGSRKKVTVFFSDIRGFTKFSEGHTPEEVVEMLNEYFQVMVSIINRHNGIVDKFIGDAIMAIWGTPTSTGDDAYAAVKSCLEMRRALNTLNEKRIARGQPAILIGMGLHTGEAISGTIGSQERMEYTVIGDTVNMTSRIEASTKSFGTDLLVSEATAEALSERIVMELAGRVEVKGKSEPLSLYKVNGFIEMGQTVLIRTPYSEYQAEATDKVKVAS